MTATIASNLNKLYISVDIDIFNAAWEVLDIRQKEKLMLDYMELLNADKFQNCFAELDGEYKALSDRSRRHNVRLDNTSDNLKLAERLKEVTYITSYRIESTKTKYSDKLDKKTIEKIVCVIKAVKQ